MLVAVVLVVTGIGVGDCRLDDLRRGLGQALTNHHRAAHLIA